MNSINNKLDIQTLFNPSAIAFVGATPVPGKWGFVIPANIIRSHYKGAFFPVNPNYNSIFGLPCYPSLSAIKEDVDLVVVTVPANKVSGVVDDCINKCVKCVIVITSDFSETGKEGALLENEIAEKARKAGLTLVGPNTMGIYNSYRNLFILMTYVKTDPGYVSIISQSGNVGTQIMSDCSKNGIGISKVVSSGNEAIIKCEDYISYFASDEKTKVIALYIESLKSGKRVLDICRDIKASKPIIIYKSGKTHSGQMAAASHTGAMAGSIEIYRSVFKQCGIIEAESSEEMTDLVGAFLAYPLPKGNRVGIITLGGGWGVITADECEARGFVLPELPAAIISRLDEMLPKYWSRRNPVDLAAVLSMEIFPKAIELMASWEGVDSVISMGGVSPVLFYDFGEYSERFGLKKEDMDILSQKVAEYINVRREAILSCMKKYDKPIIHVEIGGDDNAYENMREHNYIVFKSPERAVKVLKKMFDFYRMRERMNKA